MTWARSSVVMVPSPQISNSLNTSWQGPHHIPALIPRQGQCGKLYHCQYFMWAGWCLMMAPCNPRAVSVTVPQWPSIQIFESEEILRFKMEHHGSVPYLLSWSPHLSDFVPQSKYVHYQIRKYGLDAPNIELSTRRSARFHHWSGAWFRHCDFWWGMDSGCPCGSFLLLSYRSEDQCYTACCGLIIQNEDIMMGQDNAARTLNSVLQTWP